MGNKVKYLEGKNALITGSSMGIGKAIALEYARQGARVVINSSASAEMLRETEAEIRQRGGEVVSFLGSVADYDVAGQMVETCVEAFGSLDVLVNVAGIAEPLGSSILTMSPEDWRRQLDVHLTGTFNTCRQAAPLMLEKGSGCIINTSSHSFTGIFGGTGYPAAKGGVASLTWTIAQELKNHNIRCNAVCPGAESRLSTGPDYEANIQGLHERGILEDSLKEAALNPIPARFLAPVYAYLASDFATKITGKLLAAAGGYVGVFSPPGEQFAAYKDHTGDEAWELAELGEQLKASGLL